MDDVKGDNLDGNDEAEDEPDKPRTETTSKGELKKNCRHRDAANA